MVVINDDGTMGLALDAVLSAPSSTSQIYTLNSVICAVSVLSAIGAGWIIASFSLFPRLRTFRHQLILGLAVSDFWMAFNFLSSTIANLSGNSIGEPRLQGFCSFNGFMTQLFVVQTDYWVLLIAICTYLLLADKKHASTWLEDHRLVIWIVPWSLATITAALGLGLIGYGNIGAWCWFTSDTYRLLINFIPRWVIIVTILGLYIRLYFLIYRVHSSFVSFDDDTALTLQSAQIPARTPPPQSISMSSGPSDVCDQDMGEDSGEVYGRRGNPRLKKISYQMLSYPLVYMAIWTIPTSIRIYQSVTGNAAPFGIATVDKACIVVQGLADALVYGFNESTWLIWRDWARHPSFKN